MKNIITFILMIFLLTSMLHSQEDTFGRLYRQHNTIYSMQETTDGGFILAGNNGIIKTNASGRIEWQDLTSTLDKITTPIIGISDVIKDNDGSYILAFIKDLGESKQFCINRYSLTGMLISSHVSLESEDLILYSLKKTFDSGFIALLVIDGQHYFPILLKLNNNLGIEWQSAFQSYSSFRTVPHFTQTFDSGFVAIGANGFLTKFNSIGDTIWTNSNIRFCWLINQLQDSTFIIAGSNRLGKLNKEGILISQESTIISRPTSMDVDGSKNYIYMTGLAELAKFDFHFNPVWIDTIFKNNPYDYSFNNLLLTSTKDIIISGTFPKQNFYKGFVLKADSAGKFDYLILGYPLDLQILDVTDMLDIKWSTTFSGNINLKFSENNSLSWQNIISDYPADSAHFEWQLPGIPRNQFLIRIESVSQPDWYDQNDFPVILARKSYDYIAINECKMWFGNNGRGSSDPATSGPGFFWPGGEDATQSAIFADGLMWGGLIDGIDTVANGNTFRAGLQPGNILDNGKPADKNDAQFGIWKARKDWQALVDGPVKGRLKYDWENWPVHLGAPWKDNDNDGVYDPQIDEPDIAGDEINWMVMNDLDTAMTLNTYGSNPLGLEIRLSIYAYNQDNDLKDVVFKKYQLYNKGQNFIKDMYLGYWSDPDLGHAGDDYSGCDTTLDLAYTWNGLDEDRVYGSQPPAQGYLMLQGPVRLAMDEQAFYFDRYIDGYRNNSLSGFAVWDYSFLKVFDPFCDCIIRDFMTDPSYGIKAGSREYYNCLMGRSTMKGFKFIDPNSSQPVDIVLSGDPVAGTGWYMGDGWPGGPNPDDVRLLMSSGPFDFAPGDSQEVVYAIIMARGENNLDSITELKRKAAAVKEFYYTGVLPSAIEEAETAQPKRFSLSQNYPNPFNPTTTIEYTVGANNHSPLTVSLKIYDVLGREVKTLVNKNQSAGKYRVTIDGNGLASGIYYYRLEIGDFMQTRKMLLLR